MHLYSDLCGPLLMWYKRSVNWRTVLFSHHEHVSVVVEDQGPDPNLMARVRWEHVLGGRQPPEHAKRKSGWLNALQRHAQMLKASVP